MSRGKGGLIVVGALACMVVGAGLERVRQAVLMPLPEVTPLPEVVTSGASLRSGSAMDDGKIRETLDLLHARVAELEKTLTARDAELAALKNAKAGDAIASRRPGREDFRQRIEQLKKENPERYAAVQKQREEFHQRMEQEKQERADFLSSVSTQAMSEAQKANHDKLLETLAKIEALRAQREQAATEAGSEADKALHETMRQTMAELSVLYSTEREYLLTQAAVAAGYEGDDAAKFVDYIQQTIQSTTMRHGPGGGGPPPGM